MTPFLYFLHLKTLDILLLIFYISVADDAFINNCFFIVVIKIQFYMKMLIFQQFFVVVKMTERRKNQAKNGLTSLCYLFTL